MKIEEANIQAMTSENFQTMEFLVDQTMAQIILRDKLYTEEGKLRVVAQEYMANARDAHRACGKSDTPIEVTLPSALSGEFVVRDYGNGMSPAVIDEVFRVYGKSTKNQDNLMNGGYGIGAKCAFSYAKAFSVTTIHEGTKYTYAGAINSQNKNELMLMDTRATEEPSGAEIRVPIRRSDMDQFQRWVLEITHSWLPRPVLVNNHYDYDDTKKPIATGERWEAYRSNNPYGYRNNYTSGITVTVDDIPYRLTEDQAASLISGDNASTDDETVTANPTAYTLDLLKLLRKHNLLLVFHFKVGEITIPPQRETIDMTPKTKAALGAAVDGFIKEQLDKYEVRRAAAVSALERVSLAFSSDLELLVARKFCATNDVIQLGAKFDPVEAGIKLLRYRKGQSDALKDEEVLNEMRLKDLLKEDSSHNSYYYGNGGKFVISTGGGKYNYAELKKMARQSANRGTVYVFLVEDPVKFEAKVGIPPCDTASFGCTYLAAPPKSTQRAPRNPRTASVLVGQIECSWSYSTSTDLQNKLQPIEALESKSDYVFLQLDPKDPARVMIKGKSCSRDELAAVLATIGEWKQSGRSSKTVYVWIDRYNKYGSFDNVTTIDDYIDAFVNTVYQNARTYDMYERINLSKWVPASTWPCLGGYTHLVVPILTKVGYSDDFAQLARVVLNMEYEKYRNYKSDDDKMKKWLDTFTQVVGKEVQKALDDAEKRLIKAAKELNHILGYSPVVPVAAMLVVNAQSTFHARINNEIVHMTSSTLLTDALNGITPKNKDFSK